MRLPIRTRLTLVTTALVAVVLTGVGAFVYWRLGADLLEVVDSGLESRAAEIARSVWSGEGLGPARGLVEADDAFAQLLGERGTVLESSPGLPGRPLLASSEVAGLTASRFLTRDITTDAGQTLPARLLASPIGEGRVLVIGAALEDHREALARLRNLFAIGGPVALALVAGVGWVMTGAAFRPVEAIRREAAAISASEPDRRLPVLATGDELARLADTLNAMLARLQEALERERRFVSDASHELRTPLANLQAEVELALRRARTAEELETALRSAGEESERLSQLAKDLLVLARADGGTIPLRREPVDVGALAGQAVEAVTARAAERGVRIEAAAEPGLRARLDPSWVRQALGNLLDNALRHTPPGGRVTVAATLRDGEAVFEVRDAGEGFAEAFLPQAFEPFSRADAGRSRAEGGTGLGLALVRAVAQAHDGTATAANDPQGGAIVTLRLPAEG